MKPTRLSVLLAAAVVAGALTYLLVKLTYDSLPRLPRLAPVSLAIVAAAEFLLALGTRNRLAGRPGTEPIHPLVVARYAALAKASSLAGALATGIYAGLLGYLLSLHAPVPRAEALTAGLSVAAGLALVGAALALERTCRVKHPPENPDDLPE